MSSNLKKKYILEDKLKGFLSKLKNNKDTRYNIKKRCHLLRTKVKNNVS